MTRGVGQSSFPRLPKIVNDYTVALRRLTSAGFASGSGRRILVILPHDWSKVPRFTGVDARLAPAVHSNILQWDASLANLARLTPGVIAVDLFTAMECVFRQPQDFGFLN